MDLSIVDFSLYFNFLLLIFARHYNINLEYGLFFIYMMTIYFLYLEHLEKENILLDIIIESNNLL